MRETYERKVRTVKDYQGNKFDARDILILSDINVHQRTRSGHFSVKYSRVYVDGKPMWEFKNCKKLID